MSGFDVRFRHHFIGLGDSHHFLDRRFPLRHASPAILPQGLHPLRNGALLHFAAVTFLHDQFLQRFGHDADFVNGKPALITGLPTIIATCAARNFTPSSTRKTNLLQIFFGIIHPRCAQSGQIVRTRRCAINDFTTDASRNGSTSMSSNRVIPPTASFVCSVLKTRWPVIAARMEISAVSTSRISPTITTFGSCRRMWRRPLANVKSISGFTSICETPGNPIFHRFFNCDDAALH